MRIILLAFFALLTPGFASDEAGLLEAIRANPKEDSVRLVYADWLDEHGQPVRAEFIRLQIELARLPLDSPERALLEKREKKIIERHEAQLLPRGFRSVCPRTGPRGDFKIAWERGFPHILHIPADRLTDAKVRKALDELPVVSILDVEVSSVTSEDAQRRDLENLTELQLFQRTPGLSFRSYYLQDSALTYLIPYLKHIRHLDLGRGYLTAENASSLIRSLVAGNLEFLGFGPPAGRTNEQALELLVSGEFKKLEGLEMGGEAPTLEAFATAKLPALRALTLTEMRSPVQGDLIHFVGSPLFRQLFRLNLSLSDSLLVEPMADLIALSNHRLVDVTFKVHGALAAKLPDRLSQKLRDNRKLHECDEFVRQMAQ